MTKRGEQAVAGTTAGLINLDQSVTWRAKYFGIWLRLTSRITALERPTYFRDTMTKGAFKRFDHDHIFAPHNEGTLMKDVFDYTSPFGILGRLVDGTFLMRYMTRLLEERNEVIKAVAESEHWRAFLPDALG